MNPLALASIFNSGLDSLGEFMQYTNQAKALDSNAELLDVAGKQAVVDADFEAKRIERYGESFLSTQKAVYAKSGVELSGSPLLVMADTEKNIHLDALITRLNGARRSNDIGFEALQQRLAAGNARTDRFMALSRGILNVSAKAAYYSEKPGTVGNTGKTQSQILGVDTRKYK